MTVVEPPKVVSSWAAATATTSNAAPPASATSRAASIATKQPMRLSIARLASLPLGSSSGSTAITPTSPTLTIVFASSPSLAPMSTWRSLIFADLPRSSASIRWIGLRAITPATALPSRPVISTLWPISTTGSQPPTCWKRRKPLSSMWLTIRPISSMWPTTASVRSPGLPLTRAVEEPTRSPSTSSANLAVAARKTAEAAASRPDGPGALSRSRKVLGALGDPTR